MTSGLGYEGKKEIGAMQNWTADNYPDEVVKYFTENGQPLTAKHVDIIKNKYKDAFKETGIPTNKKSEDYTVEEKLKLQQERLESLLYQNAEQRYQNFISQYPQLFNRITITHLSSYLGVERQTLTRIRQKLSQKNNFDTNVSV